MDISNQNISHYNKFRFSAGASPHLAFTHLIEIIYSNHITLTEQLLSSKKGRARIDLHESIILQTLPVCHCLEFLIY